MSNNRFLLRSAVIAPGLGRRESNFARRQSQNPPDPETKYGEEHASHTTGRLSKNSRPANSEPQRGCVHEGDVEKIAGSQTGGRRYCWHCATGDLGRCGNRLCPGMCRDCSCLETNGKVGREPEDYLRTLVTQAGRLIPIFRRAEWRTIPGTVWRGWRVRF